MDIHNYKRRLGQSLAKIMAMDISQANKEADNITYLVIKELVRDERFRVGF